MNTKIFLFVVATFLAIQVFAQTVTDIDGNVYNTIAIGNRLWMKENLKVTRFNNGANILLLTDNGMWGSYATAAYCYYNNDSASMAPLFGALYNFYAVHPTCVPDTLKLCPQGWHVPSDHEWNEMEYYLDNSVDTSVSAWTGTDIGTILKDTLNWLNANLNTNSTGFTAEPGGMRTETGLFQFSFLHGRWWTSTDYPWIWTRELINNSSQIYRGFGLSNYGLSVRCICDLMAGQNERKTIGTQLHIYPNPATNFLYVEHILQQKLSVSVYSIVGQLLFQNEIFPDNAKIDISSLPKGIYIVHVSCSDLTIQKKIIKE